MNPPLSAKRNKSIQRIYGCSYDEVCEIGFDIATKFQMHRHKARMRGIEFQFTLPEWWKLWNDSGYWDKRGVTGYVMCRTGDVGPYAAGNVYIATARHNIDTGRRNKADAAYARYCARAQIQGRAA